MSSSDTLGGCLAAWVLVQKESLPTSADLMNLLSIPLAQTEKRDFLISGRLDSEWAAF